MGNTYHNIVLRGAEQAAVIAAVERLRQAAFVTPIIEGHIVVYPEAYQGIWLAARLSRELHGPAFSVAVYDDDVLVYDLFADGVQTDHYDSNPGFGTGRQLPPEGGNAELLCAAFGISPEHAPEIEAILHSSPYTAADGKSTDFELVNQMADYPYLFATERHDGIVEQLALPLELDYATSYQQVERGHVPGAAFSSVADISVNHPSHAPIMKEFLLLNPPLGTDAEAVTLWFQGDDDGEEIISFLGDRDKVRADIADALPETDLDVANWLIAPGNGYTLDFSLGVQERIEAATIYELAETQTASERAETRLRHLSDITGWRVYSTETGAFL